MTLTEFRDILVALGDEKNIPVHHFSALGEDSAAYIVWAEDSQATASWGNDRMQEQTLAGTVDYFTKAEYDPDVMAIQDAMNSGDISLDLNSIQYEDDTGYTHYEWVFGGVVFG